MKHPEKMKKGLRLAVIRQGAEGTTCNCGWVHHHPRLAVREKAIQRHLDKRHEGRGIRL